MATQIKVQKQEDASIAFDITKQLKQLLQDQNLNFWKISSKLYDLKYGHHYLALGYDTFKDYANSNDLGMARSTIYAYIGIFEVYIIIHKIPLDKLVDIPYDKLQMAVSKARKLTPEQMEEFIEKVRELSRSDLQFELQDGKQDQDKTSEETQDQPKTKIVKMFYHEQCHRYRIDDDLSNICMCDAKQVYHFKDVLDVLSKIKEQKKGLSYISELGEDGFALMLRSLRLNQAKK